MAPHASEPLLKDKCGNGSSTSSAIKATSFAKSSASSPKPKSLNNNSSTRPTTLTGSTMSPTPSTKPRGSAKPSTPSTPTATTPLSSLTNPQTTNLANHQCGDPSHETYRHIPALESRIRHNCDLPKVETRSQDPKGRTVTTIVHRHAVVTSRMLAAYHQIAEARWKANGGKVPSKPETPNSKTEDKALADRKELEDDDDWEVIDGADVDDGQDTRGQWSNQKVRALDDGLQ